MYVVTRTVQKNYLVDPTLARRAVSNALRDVSKRTTGNHYKMKHNTQGDLLSILSSIFYFKNVFKFSTFFKSLKKCPLAIKT